MDHHHHAHRITEWGGWALAAVLGLGMMVRERAHGPPFDAVSAASPAVQAAKIASPAKAADDAPDPFYPQKVKAPVAEMPDQF